MKKRISTPYLLDFLSVFVAVLAAFALNNWNDNRRDSKAESKILAEISNGLQKDVEDVKMNVLGHQQGVKACAYWRRLLLHQETNPDTLQQYFFILTRDFVSVQNTSGYETLKSKGLELLRNDSLRSEVISLYEYDYKTFIKLEKEYDELQFQSNYFLDFNRIVAPSLKFNELGMISGMNLPLDLPEAESNILLTYLWKMEVNRRFILQFYEEVEVKIEKLQHNIGRELQD